MGRSTPPSITDPPPFKSKAERAELTVPIENSLRTIGRKPRAGRPRNAKHPWEKLDSDQEDTNNE